MFLPADNRLVKKQQQSTMAKERTDLTHPSINLRLQSTIFVGAAISSYTMHLFATPYHSNNATNNLYLPHQVVQRIEYSVTTNEQATNKVPLPTSCMYKTIQVVAWLWCLCAFAKWVPPRQTQTVPSSPLCLSLSRTCAGSNLRTKW